jgi:hypothetical protein
MLLATNVLGMEAEELSPEHARDALKELVNVTCGELLVALSGKKTVFNLSVPVIEKIDAACVKKDLTRPDTLRCWWMMNAHFIVRDDRNMTSTCGRVSFPPSSGTY